MRYNDIYGILDISFTEKSVSFKNTNLNIESISLTKYLKKSTKAVIIAATLGISADKKIQELQQKSLAEAVIYDKKCLDFIESSLDETVVKLEKDYNIKLKPRYSPGFGDFSVKYQKPILDTLNASVKLGITVTKQNYMIPSKSVTAIIGVKD